MMKRTSPFQESGLILAVLVWVWTSSAMADHIEVVAGGGDQTTAAPALESKLNTPFGVDIDTQGVLYFVELDGHRMGRIDRQGQLTVVAGTGVAGYTGDGGPATQGQVNSLHNLSIAPTGKVYLSDTWNHVVRMYDPQTGVVSTVAGTGVKGFSGDGGPALQAQFGGIYCVTVSRSGQSLLLADLDNRRIRVLDFQTGRVRTLAGNGMPGVPVDGELAIAQPLVDPRAVVDDDQGRIYILERGGHALRVVDELGRISTLVGTGKKGHTGDGGPARDATLNGPKHLCFDRDGTILIADTDNHVIRRYDPVTQRITHVAGIGKAGADGLDGPLASLELSQPHGVFVHPSGQIYISDSYNHRILKITPGDAP